MQERKKVINNIREKLLSPSAQFKAWFEKEVPADLQNRLSALIKIGREADVFSLKSGASMQNTMRFYHEATEYLRMPPGTWAEQNGFDSSPPPLTQLFVLLGKIEKIYLPSDSKAEKKPDETKRFRSVSELATLVEELHALANNKSEDSLIKFVEKMLAANQIDEDIVKQPDADGNTLLHLVSKNKDIARIIALLQPPFNSFDIQAKNAAGQTSADLWSHLLSSAKPDIQALRATLMKYSSNDTASMTAFFEGVATAPAVVHAKDSGGRTALHTAASQADHYKIQTLLLFGADPTVQDKHGKTPFDLLPSHTLSSTKKCLKITPVKPAEDKSAANTPPASPIVLATTSTLGPREHKEIKWVLPKTLRDYAEQLQSCKNELESYLAKPKISGTSTTAATAVKSDETEAAIAFKSYETENTACLLLLFKSQLQPFVVSPQNETFHIVSLGAGAIYELVPLLILAQQKGIKIHLWAIDNNPKDVELIKDRYAPSAEHFTYLNCDATHPEMVKKAIEAAGGKFKGAALTLLRQPDANGRHGMPPGKEDAKTRAAFHTMTTKTLPFVAAPDGIVWCSWYWQSEVNTTCRSMAEIRGVYTTISPPTAVRFGAEEFAVGGRPLSLPDRFAAIYQCKGQGFGWGKELRNLCVDEVSYEDFATRLPDILSIDPLLIHEPGPTTGDTALHYAAERGNVEKISLLLKKGADINAKNKKGLTAFDVLKKGQKYSETLLKDLTPAVETKRTAPPRANELSKAADATAASAASIAPKDAFLPPARKPSDGVADENAATPKPP